MDPAELQLIETPEMIDPDAAELPVALAPPVDVKLVQLFERLLPQNALNPVKVVVSVLEIVPTFIELSNASEPVVPMCFVKSDVQST